MFDLEDLSPEIAPIVDCDVKRVLELLSVGDVDCRVRAGAVWDRKSYPQCGSLSPKVSPSPYRSTYGEQRYFVVELLVSNRTSLSQLTEEIIESDERQAALAIERAKEEKRQRIAILRAQADRLEGELP